ncbi:hypothetical protein H6G64_34595 [Calothrix sp. FACHB-156]|nr:hypothetical protein [Nostoc linckia FACHB-104]MBD2342059.1 hypothetical protein [Calothrix sp. FACHB-156]
MKVALRNSLAAFFRSLPYFEPLLVPGGLLAGNLGQIIGVGKGYGIALLFILMGMLTLTNN